LVQIKFDHNQMRFCLVFDFDTNILAQQYYQFTGNNSWRNAYTAIRLSLTGIGWIHIQGTVYFSQNNANLGEILNLVNTLRQLQYLRPAIRNIMVFEMSGETDIQNFL
jgi:virulence-associated protein VapD